MRYDDAPFDPENPFDSLADDARQKVADLAIWFVQDERYLAMSEADRFACFVAGVMTGVMGAVHALVHEESQHAAAEVVESYIASAAMNAREIAEKAVRYDS